MLPSPVTCSKLTIETLEQGVNHVDDYCKLLTYFTPSSNVSIVYYEHVIVSLGTAQTSTFGLYSLNVLMITCRF